MSKTNMYLKIYYSEPGSKSMKILAEVNKSQLYHLENNWVELINYNRKLINKYDITQLKLLDEVGEIDLAMIRSEKFLPPQVEALEISDNE
ncbi:hypothetical protein LCGC14_1237580 [marine sediment metagenome]|uniref:Uncharacterized protein n=1 Tax=marine sediment metagenome TaxID=412755 RepID=A0A0F9NNZ8_9ZZZZ